MTWQSRERAEGCVFFYMGHAPQRLGEDRVDVLQAVDALVAQPAEVVPAQ